MIERQRSSPGVGSIRGSVIPGARDRLMRSLLAVAAAAFFAYNAVTFLPWPAYLNEGAPGGIDGDAGIVGVVWAARMLAAGFALIALALIDWQSLARVFRPSRPQA